MTTTSSNHALQRTRPSRSGCNPRVPRAGSLSLGRSSADRGDTHMQRIARGILVLMLNLSVLAVLFEDICPDDAG
jgi:hypothetical protein